MTEKPEALRLAQELDAYHTRSCHKEAAIELRRQHADNERLRDELRQNGIDYTRAEVERLKGLLKETRPFLLAMSADALLGRIAQALQEPPR